MELIVEAVTKNYFLVNDGYKPLRADKDKEDGVALPDWPHENPHTTLPAIMAIGLATLHGVDRETIDTELSLGDEGEYGGEYGYKYACFAEILRLSTRKFIIGTAKLMRNNQEADEYRRFVMCHFPNLVIKRHLKTTARKKGLRQEIDWRSIIYNDEVRAYYSWNKNFRDKMYDRGHWKDWIWLETKPEFEKVYDEKKERYVFNLIEEEGLNRFMRKMDLCQKYIILHRKDTFVDWGDIILKT